MLLIDPCNGSTSNVFDESLGNQVNEETEGEKRTSGEKNPVRMLIVFTLSHGSRSGMYVIAQERGENHRRHWTAET